MAGGARGCIDAGMTGAGAGGACYEAPGRRWGWPQRVAEARTAFGSTGPATAPASSGGLERHLTRAGRAEILQRAGRHAAAERLLLDVAGACLRRDARGPAAASCVALGRLRLERGRAAEAEAIFASAAAHARTARDEALELVARGWQAAALADAARLVDAEALCRQTLPAGGRGEVWRAQVEATLLRVLLWQGRVEDAAALVVDPSCDDPEIHVYARSVAIRVHLAAGDVFEAGRRAWALAEAVPPSASAQVRILVSTGLLRVALAGGDLRDGRRHLDEVARLARLAHVGLRAMRARLLWVDALTRAGLVDDARREVGRLARCRRALPPLLRAAIDARVARRPMPHPAMPPGDPWRLVSVLVATTNDAKSDAEGVRHLAQHAREMVAAGRVSVLQRARAAEVATSGSGATTRLGARVLECGMPLESGTAAGGWEVGIPVRSGGRIVGALVAAWAAGRAVPDDARARLEVAAALMAASVGELAADPTSAAASMPELVGDSAVMQALRRAVARAARAPFAVLVEGESGSGKELVARALHRLGPRRDGPFRDVNCAALPDELVESELFGHERGAFTGAVVERPGLLEEADGGTLFLDEVVDLSLRAQAKVLRAIQQQEVRRLGAGASRRVDTRVVSAANRDLREEVAAGRFRPDLLYRLDVIRIRVPSLRERREDVPALARHIWRQAAGQVGCGASLDAGVVEALCRYRWPGNVRELQNVIAGLAVAAPARGRVDRALLPGWLAEAGGEPPIRLAEARAGFERQVVEAAMVRAGGQRARAARELGISRQGLLKLMARVGLSPARGDR